MSHSKFSLPENYIELYDMHSQHVGENPLSQLHTIHMGNRLHYVEEYLNSILKDTQIPRQLSDAMRYSLMAGGKRIRPILCLSCAKLCTNSSQDDSDGNDASWQSILPIAASLEMIHTYSLIHDDLPAMDNDDLRRGKPTCHKAFNEGTAILAGDGLLTDAFYYMTNDMAHPARSLAAVRLIAKAVGSQGMVGGQMLDLEAEGKNINLEELCILNAMKTGALLQCSCEVGALIAGADEETRHAIGVYGKSIGIAFQIIDDVLDIIGDTATLGKTVGSDVMNDKSTWPALIGLDESKKKAQAYCAEAVEALEQIDNAHMSEKRFLQKTALDMAHRVY